MSEAIAVALIGLLGSMAGSAIGFMAGIKLINYRIEQLEKKVEKHNNLVERTYQLETEEEVMRTDLKHLEEEVQDLKKYHAP
ncbi:MAG: hypothetical protein IKY91_02310 [Akkermansia sp.]|nr:hypothetical protein [Akkermansia sp.]